MWSTKILLGFLKIRGLEFSSVSIFRETKHVNTKNISHVIMTQGSNLNIHEFLVNGSFSSTLSQNIVFNQNLSFNFQKFTNALFAVKFES